MSEASQDIPEDPPTCPDCEEEFVMIESEEVCPSCGRTLLDIQSPINE